MRLKASYVALEPYTEEQHNRGEFNMRFEVGPEGPSGSVGVTVRFSLGRMPAPPEGQRALHNLERPKGHSLDRHDRDHVPKLRCGLSVGLAFLLWLSAACQAAVRPNYSAKATRAESDASRAASPAVDAAQSGRLEEAKDLEREGRLAEALHVLADISLEFPRNRELMRETSGRLESLLRHRALILGTPARIPLVDSSIPLPLVQGSVGGRTGLFLWDSGAEATGLDQALCADLGLPRFGTVSVIAAGGSNTDGHQFAILEDPIMVGSLHIDVPPVVCIDLTSITAVDSRILGILGGNLLRSSPYQINFGERWLEVGGKIPSDLIRLESSFSGSLPYVSLEVDGHPVRFLLDTGAARSGITQTTLDEIGVESTASAGETVTRVVAGGTVEVELKVVSFSRFRSNQLRGEMIQFTVEAPNLVGGDFFGKRTLVVDHGTGIVAFTAEP